VLGLNAGSGLNRPDGLTSIAALVAVIMRARSIARAPASKRHIAYVGIRPLLPSQNPKHALPPMGPSRAPNSILKTLKYFRRKTTMLDPQ
jgi:hypothetical protein